MKKGLLGFLLVCAIGLTGCATHIAQPTSAPMAAKVKLGTFTKVELSKCVISDKLRGSNESAIKKIDENLLKDISGALQNVSQVAEPKNFTAGSGTLQIIPEIKDIKFIGGAARFMVGAMAGSSAVLISLTCKDAATGDVVAQGEFYKSGNAYSGSWSIGVSDNMMLDDVAREIGNYLSANR